MEVIDQRPPMKCSKSNTKISVATFFLRHPRYDITANVQNLSEQLFDFTMHYNGHRKSLLISWPDLLRYGDKRQRVLGVHTCVYKLYHTFSVSLPTPGFSKGPGKGLAGFLLLPK